jgi:hypothetical protein
MRATASMVVLTLILAVACKTKSPEANLRTRITAARTSQYCRPGACFNPYILAFEGGYLITSFAGRTPFCAAVHSGELEERLLALLMSTWPQGPTCSNHPQ